MPSDQGFRTGWGEKNMMTNSTGNDGTREMLEGDQDDQLRRTSLLLQLSIEFRETLDPVVIVERMLQVMVNNLGITNASVVLIGTDGDVELAISLLQGTIQQVKPIITRAVLDRGLAGWSLRNNRSVVLPDVSRDKRWIPYTEWQRTGSALVLPIHHAQTTLGVLTVYHPTPNYFASRDMLLMEGVAAQAGVALGSSRRYREESRRREQALALFSMSQYLTAEHTYEDLATMLQKKSVAVFGVDYGLLFLVKENTRLVPVAIPTALSHPSHRLLIKQATMVARNACDRKSIVTDADSPDMPTQAFMAVPLMHRGTISGVIVLVRTSGDHVTFSASVWSVLTTFANVIATTCANMDLVEQLKRHTEALEGMVAERTHLVERSRDLLRIVLDHLPDGLVLIDPQEVILEANRAFSSTVLGRDPEAIIGEHFPAIWEELERRGELHIEIVQPARGGGGEKDGARAMRVFCTDVHHHQHWYEVHRIPVVGRPDEVEYYVEQWVDVTQQEALQRHLVLQEQRNILGHLTSSVVHDISPHLHTIQTNLQACIEDDRLPAEVRARLEDTLGEASRIDRTLDSLNQFSQSPSTAWECLDIKHMLIEVQQATARQFAAAQITTLLDFDTQDQRVYGQPDALRQVFLGILFNAQEAMPHGGTIRIIGRWCQDEEEYQEGNEDQGRKESLRACWHISILDTGEGMTTEQLAAIFEPFKSTRSHGMGLGLYLSKQIITQHGGEIELSSQVGRGTIVEIFLPCDEQCNGGREEEG